MTDETKLKPVRIVLEGRSTGRGAYTQNHIYSLRQKKEINPQRTEKSGTGNHWEDIFFLLPGKYLMATQDISNSGKHNCGYSCLIVSAEDWNSEAWREKIPDFVCPPCDCLAEPEGED